MKTKQKFAKKYLQRETGSCGCLALAVFFIVIVIGVIILGALSTEITPSSQDTGQSKEQSSQTTKQQALLELLSIRCYSKYGYFYMVGEVKNISDKSLGDVIAVGNAYDEKGQLLSTDKAFLEYNPILPRQSSSFEVIMLGHPDIKECKVGFKELWGGSIPTKKK